MHDPIFESDKKHEGYGKAYAISPAGNLVLIGGSHPDPETGRAPLPAKLKPGWRWADESEVAAVHQAAHEVAIAESDAAAAE